MKILIIFCLFSSLNLIAQDRFLEFGDKNYKPKKSKWLVELGAKTFESDLNIPKYTGTHHEIKGKKPVRYYGPELAVGGSLHLFYGLSLDLKGRVYLLSDLKGEIGKASKDFNYDLAKVKSKSEFIGQEAVGKLNYTFETKLVEIKPFFELGIGASRSKTEVNYDFEGLAAGDDEYYKANLENDYITRRLSLGIEVVSSYGIYSYFKASQENYTALNEKLKAKYKDKTGATGDTNANKKNLNQESNFMSYALGFGVLF